MNVHGDEQLAGPPGRTVRSVLLSISRRWSRTAGWVAAGVLIGVVIGSCQGRSSLLIPASQSYSVQVTFKNCGKPYPCEVIQNGSDEPVTLTVTNTYQHEVIVVPAHAEVVVELDASDNR
jgi:hypothetical protein